MVYYIAHNREMVRNLRKLSAYLQQAHAFSGICQYSVEKCIFSNVTVVQFAVNIA